ncbi:MAG TPA: hypothetical protein VM143_14995 [Acidimicrobiales bacterium]|nr:hypothetical protein [Acidimicrobiales bacterium]
MPLSSRRALAALVAVALGILGACSLQRSGYQFVRSPSTGTYLKVPQEWTVYGQKDIEKLLAEADPGTERDPFPFISVFDAGEHPQLDLDLGADDPVGLIRVRELAPTERDAVSFATARNEFHDALNDALESGEAPLRKMIEIRQRAADGQRIVFSYTDEATGQLVTLDQTTLVDRDKHRIYLLVVGCEAGCYERNRNQIDDVVSSLTIKER